MNVNAHGGSSSPDYGEHPASLSMWIVETAWFSHRPLWTFILAGVFDRFPALRLVLAEQGSGWIRDALDVMDNFYAQIAQGNVGVMRFADPQLLERMPSEYWQSNCMVAASFLHRERLRRAATASASTTSCGAPTTPTWRARRRSRTRPSA